MADPVAEKTRELVMVQIGSQVLALCEANARIAVLEERIAAVQRAHDAVEQAKTGMTDAAVLATLE